MNCSKCNQPMKEYHGLFEKDLYCDNPDCGKKIVNTTPHNDAPDYYADMEAIFGGPSKNSDKENGDSKNKLKVDFSKVTVKLPGSFPQLDAPNPSDAEREIIDSIVKALEEGCKNILGWTTEAYDLYEVGPAHGAELDRLAELCFGIYRYFDETDEDLRFRLKASLDQ